MTAAATAALQADLPRGVTQQRGLPAAGGTDDRQDHRIRMIEEAAERFAFGDIGWQVG